MSNPNEDQWNGQTGQPNQSQPNQPNPAGQPGQPQYGAYDSNHGGQYPPQGAPGAQDTQNQHAQNGQPQGEPNQNPYYARTPTIRTMARTASRHGGRTVGGIRRTANRIAKRTGSRMVHGAIKVNPAGSRPTGMSQFQSIPPDRGMAAGKSQDQDSHHLRRGGRGAIAWALRCCWCRTRRWLWPHCCSACIS